MSFTSVSNNCEWRTNGKQSKQGAHLDYEDSLAPTQTNQLRDVVRNQVNDAFFKQDGKPIIKKQPSRNIENNFSAHSNNNNFNINGFSCDEDNDSDDSSISDTSASNFPVSTKNYHLATIPHGKLECADCGKIVDAKFLHNHMQYVHRNVVHRKGKKGTLLPAAKKEKSRDINNGPYYFEKDIGIQCSLSPDLTITPINTKRKLDDKYEGFTREGKRVRDGTFKTVYDSLVCDSDRTPSPVLFVCFRCFQDFPSRSLLEDHVAKTHNNDTDNLVKCHKCKEWVPFQTYKSHPNCKSPESSVLAKEPKYNVLTVAKSEEGLSQGKTDDGKISESTTGQVSECSSASHPALTLTLHKQKQNYLSLNCTDTMHLDAPTTPTLVSPCSDKNISIYSLQPSGIHSLEDLNNKHQIIQNNQEQIVIIKKGSSFDRSHRVESDEDDEEMFFDERGLESGGDQVLDVVVNVDVDTQGGCHLHQLTGDCGPESAFLSLHGGPADSLHDAQQNHQLVESLTESLSPLVVQPAGGASILDKPTVELQNPSASICNQAKVPHANTTHNTHKGGNTNISTGGTDTLVGDTNALVGGTNAIVGGTNALVGGTNAIVGGTNALVGGTNALVVHSRLDKRLGLRGGGSAVLGLRDNGTSALGLREEGTPVLVGGPSLTGTKTKLSLRTDLGVEGEEETTATIVLGKQNQGSVQLPVTAEAMQLGQEYVDLATGTKYMVVIQENSDPNSGKIILQP